jgi:hypothetical protein
MYRKRGRKSMRKGRRKTRRVRRGGGDLTDDINSRHAAYVMSPDRLGPK